MIWHVIAFAMSLCVPTNGIFISLWHAIFGPIYVVYWIMQYQDLWISFFKNLLN